MEAGKDIEQCEWCHRYYPVNSLKRIPIFFGWCYQLICQQCDKKYPVPPNKQRYPKLFNK
jgi:hypothetical protein